MPYETSATHIGAGILTDLPVLGLEELFSLHVSPLPPERLPLFDVGLCVPLICLPDFTAKRKADMTGQLVRTSESAINHSCLLSELGSQRVDNSIFDSYFYRKTCLFMARSRKAASTQSSIHILIHYGLIHWLIHYVLIHLLIHYVLIHLLIYYILMLAKPFLNEYISNHNSLPLAEPCLDDTRGGSAVLLVVTSSSSVSPSSSYEGNEGAGLVCMTSAAGGGG